MVASRLDQDVCWQIGIGAVSLVMASVSKDNEVQEFDFCFTNYGDIRWYADPSFTQKEQDLKASNGSLRKGKPMDQLSKDVEFQLRNFLFAVLTINCSEHFLAWFMLRIFSFVSSASEATLGQTAPLIPTNNNAYSPFERLLAYAILSCHLNRDSNKEDETYGANESSTESNTIVTNVLLVKSRIGSMPDATQKNTNNCAKNSMQFEQELKKNIITPAKMEAIMVALWLSCDCARVCLFEADKNKKTTKGLRSITDSTAASTNEEESST